MTRRNAGATGNAGKGSRGAEIYIYAICHISQMYPWVWIGSDAQPCFKIILNWPWKNHNVKTSLKVLIRKQTAHTFWSSLKVLPSQHSKHEPILVEDNANTLPVLSVLSTTVNWRSSHVCVWVERGKWGKGKGKNTFCAPIALVPLSILRPFNL